MLKISYRIINPSVLLFLTAFISSSPTEVFCQTEEPSVFLSSMKKHQFRLHFQLVRMIPTSNNSSYSTVDIDSDGMDEFLFTTTQRTGLHDKACVQLEGILSHSIRFRENFDGQISEPTLHDLDGNGIQEFFVPELIRDSCFIHVLDNEGRRIQKILIADSKSYGGKEHWDCSASVEQLMDINGDGYQDGLIRVITGFEYQPRGVYAYDFHNKRFLWKYATGFVVTHILPYDVDRDGRMEIVFASSAPGNWQGIPVNGTDDVHSYLTALNLETGEMIRQIIIGEGLSGTQLFMEELNERPGKEIVVRYVSNQKPKELDFIALWDPNKNLILNKVKTENNILSRPGFIDIDADGRNDVVMGWDNGIIEIRNGYLQPMLKRKFVDFEPDRVKIFDIDNDGQEEIFVRGRLKGISIIVMVNHELYPLAFLYPENMPSISLLNSIHMGFGSERALMVRIGENYYIYSVGKNLANVIGIPWIYVVCGMGAGLGLAALFSAVLIPRKTREIRYSSVNEIFQSVETGAMLVDSTGKVVCVNSPMVRFLRRTEEAILNNAVESAFQDIQNSGILRAVKATLSKNKLPYQNEFTLLGEKESMNVLLGIREIGAGRNGYSYKLITLQDISGLIHSKRMAAWASMAQNLAHEIKTPLSTVLLSAQRLQLECGENPDGDGKYAYIDRILEQVKRLQKMTDGFLKLSNIQRLQLKRININKLTGRMMDSYRLKAGAKIKIERMFSEKLPVIYADTEKLTIALKNIIDNSLNAMDGKGTLNISTRLIESLNKKTNGANGKTVEIEISDTGKGISPEDLPLVFKPFFSRSENGTGLGLVIAQKIIEDHNGNIEVKSELGIGTTIQITIPAVGH